MNDSLQHIPKQQFDEVVHLIRDTRTQMLSMANTALIDLYWQLGAFLSNKIESSQWGEGVIKQLAEYIARTSPDLKGFSAQNLWRMKQFYETYRAADEKLSPLVREISWTNNLIILSRTKTIEEKAFYLNLCAEQRLSKRELERQIDSALYERSLLTEPKLSPMLREIAPQADQVFRDHYVMEFIGGKEYKTENSMKSALIQQMKQFILEFSVLYSLPPMNSIT